MINVDKITELKQERASLVKKQRKIIDKAEEKDRGLNSEEKKKFDRMDEEIDNLEGRISKLKKMQEREKKEIEKELGKESKEKGKGKEYKKAFNAWMRRGRKELTREQATTLREKRAMNVANASKGGYLVPSTTENRIIEKLTEASIMRQICRVETTSTETNIPVSTGKPTFGWVDELGTYPETDSEYGQKSVDAWKVGGIIKVSEELLYDNTYNLESRIERDSIDGLQEEEELGFVVGDNVKKPRGFTLDAEVGKEAAAVDALTFNELIDLVYSLKRPYRRNARFLLDDPVAKAIRKIKNNNDQYVWQPSVQSGEPDRLLNYPVNFSYAMPEMATENKPVAFGDFDYYEIYDRQGIFMQRLQEKYADDGQIGFKVYRRTDGILTVEEAIKTLQMA